MNPLLDHQIAGFWGFFALKLSVLIYLPLLPQTLVVTDLSIVSIENDIKKSLPYEKQSKPRSPKEEKKKNHGSVSGS